MPKNPSASESGPGGGGGTPGTPGTVLRSGVGVPSNSLGVDGDYYLNTTTGAGAGDLYQRAAGVYSIVGNLKGPTGATGGTGGTGATGAPGSSVLSSQPGAAVANAPSGSLLSSVVTAPAAPVVGESWEWTARGQVLNNSGGNLSLSFLWKYGAGTAIATVALTSTIATATTSRPFLVRVRQTFRVISATVGVFDITGEIFVGASGGGTFDNGSTALSQFGGVLSAAGADNAAANVDLQAVLSVTAATVSVTPAQITVVRSIP